VRGNSALPTFLGPADRRFPMVPVADIAAAAVILLRGPEWRGRRVVELSSFDASPAEVATALGAALGKPIAPVVLPREQWAGILAGNGFSAAVVDAFVGMYDGINGGVVVAQGGADRRTGQTSLDAAAAALLQAA